MNEEKNTPLPWSFDEEQLFIMGQFEGAEVEIAEIFCDRDFGGNPCAIADGRLIVSAVNNQPLLAEAEEVLARIVDWVNEPGPKNLEEDRAFLINTAYRISKEVLARIRAAKGVGL